MNHTGFPCEFYGRLVDVVSQEFVAIPDDGALASLRFDDDVADLSACALYDFREFDVNPFIPQRLQAQASFGVRTKTSGVSGPHTQALQRNDGRRRLSTRSLRVRQQMCLRIMGRVVGHDNKMV